MPNRPKKRHIMDRREAIRMLRDLESLVVSLDRIGSAFADHARERSRALLAFVNDGSVFQKLAGVRRGLNDLCSDKRGPDGMDELEREVQDAPMWSLKHPKPPRSYAARERAFIRKLERRAPARPRRRL
jgi:hypothetical protein